MKYSIHINQLALQEIAPKITLTEASILDFIIAFHSSARADPHKYKTILLGNKLFVWIDLGNLLSEMPILKIKSKGTLSKVLGRLAIFKLIEKHLYKNELYISPGEMVKNLFFEQMRFPMETRSFPGGKASVSPGKREHNTIEHNTSNPLSPGGDPETEKPAANPQVKKLIDFFFESCKSMKGWGPEISGSTEGAMIKQKLRRYSEEDLKEQFDWFLNSDESFRLGCTIKVALSNYVFNKWLAQRQTY